jgi:hypothetical protein
LFVASSKKEGNAPIHPTWVATFSKTNIKE